MGFHFPCDGTVYCYCVKGPPHPCRHGCLERGEGGPHCFGSWLIAPVQPQRHFNRFVTTRPCPLIAFQPPVPALVIPQQCRGSAHAAVVAGLFAGMKSGFLTQKPPKKAAASKAKPSAKVGGGASQKSADDAPFAGLSGGFLTSSSPAKGADTAQSSPSCAQDSEGQGGAQPQPERSDASEALGPGANRALFVTGDADARVVDDVLGRVFGDQRCASVARFWTACVRPWPPLLHPRPPTVVWPGHVGCQLHWATGWRARRSWEGWDGGWKRGCGGGMFHFTSQTQGLDQAALHYRRRRLHQTIGGG